MRWSRLGALLAASLALGCLPDVTPPDFGDGGGAAHDGGTADGGTADGGTLDSEPRVYVMDPGGRGLFHVALDGTDAVTLLGSELDAARGLGLDPEAGRLYWGERANPGRLRRISTTGGAVETAVVDVPWPDEVRVHPSAGFVYWHDELNGNLQGIWRAALDGTGATELLRSEDLETADAEHSPGAFVVDEERGKIYWAKEVVFDANGFSDAATLMVSELDGTGAEPLLEVAEGINGLALDAARGQLYFTTELTVGAVERVDVDGTSRERLLDATRPGDIALEPESGALLFIAEDASGPALWRAALDGTGAEVVVPGEVLDYPYGLAVGPGPAP